MMKIVIPAGLILLCSFVVEAAAKLDACVLLTKAEAAALLGEAVKEGKHGMMESDGSGGTAVLTQCIYRSVSNSGKSADLVVRESPSSEKISASVETIRKTLKEMATVEPQNISGVGDKAFWAPVGKGSFRSIQLNVFRGDSTYLLISVRGFSDNQSLEKAKTIAQKTLDRLRP